jgi:very-short-patch-repair endonuclease
MSSPATYSTLFQPEYRAPGLTGVDTQRRIKEYILDFCPKLVTIGGWSDSNRYTSIINATKSAVHEHAFGPRVLNNYREWVIPCFQDQPVAHQARVLMIVRAAFPELGLFYDTWPVRYLAILTIKVFNNNERLRGLRRKATEEETRGHNDARRRELSDYRERGARKLQPLLLMRISIDIRAIVFPSFGYKFFLALALKLVKIKIHVNSRLTPSYNTLYISIKS